MRFAGKKRPAEGLGRKFSAFGARFVPSKSVVLIGLLYACITACVVRLLGGGRGSVLFGFMLGGACAAKIAALVRADILQSLHTPDISSEFHSGRNGPALPYEPERAELPEMFASRPGGQRADDTADV